MENAETRRRREGPDAAEAMHSCRSLYFFEKTPIDAAASFAHRQNFSVAGLSRPFRAAMPKDIGFGSGVSRTNFTRLPKV